MKPTAKEALLTQEGLQVINVGLELFAGSLQQQEVEVVHVMWQPPADGDAELMNLLDQLL